MELICFWLALNAALTVGLFFSKYGHSARHEKVCLSTLSRKWSGYESGEKLFISSVFSFASANLVAIFWMAMVVKNFLLDRSDLFAMPLGMSAAGLITVFFVAAMSFIVYIAAASSSTKSCAAVAE